MEEKKDKDVIDLNAIVRTLWHKRKVFYMVWTIVFVVSCLWILPQPRWYSCEVELAPENSEQSASGLAGLASSFGINLGEITNSDAIYPTLYPDLFESPEFLVDIMGIKIETNDGTIKTDYYTYLKKYQKHNWLTEPFVKTAQAVGNFFGKPEDENKGRTGKKGGLNSFYLSKKDYDLVEKVKSNITCSVDKKTDVITINVKDQDRLVCATLADSIRERLQAFIIDYRTKKVRQDEVYYKHLADSAKIEYLKTNGSYGAYQDSHRNVVEQTTVQQGEKIKNDLDAKLQAYNTFNTQYQAMKAKVQERTPSFTTLKSATVPQKPAGPKRMIFIIGMLFLSTLITSIWVSRRHLHMTI